MQLLGWIDRDLSRLPEYCRLVAETTGVPLPDNYPVVGRDAFRTGTGVHAAAIIKARAKGDDWLADRIYSGVPASADRPPPGDRGRADERRVERRLLARGARHRADRELVAAIFTRAKAAAKVLGEAEILAICGEHRTRRSA